MDVRLIAGALRRCKIFNELNAEQLSLLAELSEPVLFSPREVIFSASDPGDSLLVIATGQVEMLVQVGEELRVLDTLEAGESFGELSLLLPGSRMVTARAVEELSLIELAHPSLRMIETSDPALAIEILRAVREKVGPALESARPLIQSLFEQTLQRSLMG